MTLLLDTRVVLWWLADDPALGPVAREAIADPDGPVYISAASAWEIAIKRQLGKLDAPDDLLIQVGRGGFLPLSIDIEDGHHAGSLPRHHDDPFDRMLVAQARRRHLTIVSRDPSFPLYDVAVLDARY